MVILKYPAPKFLDTKYRLTLTDWPLEDLNEILDKYFSSWL